ncbi:MAG TPA: tRNA (guanosine(46)-N7)-methyltransferase TrmB [Phycisphaerales bacterium]|nr:tRNA (guanosine(46)-N7)-methyltransferase TrmB [Phycisphaerales bacterium]
MSFGLSRGRPLDTAPGVVMVSEQECGPLPDEIISDPNAGRLDPRTWFPLRNEHPDRPFEVEIGSGKGTFLIQQAPKSPGTDYLGIEWAAEFCTYAADRIRRARLPNVRLIRTDATELLRWRFPDGIVDVIHLYFSDPWPKARHHKKRVIQDRFLADAWRVLVPGGELRIVTDHDDLWRWDREHIERWCGPGPCPHHEGPVPAFAETDFTAPDSADQDELVGTNFERKFRREGRSFHATVLRKLTKSHSTGE